MAVTFKIPKSPTKQVYESTIFLGADFTSEASTVDETKSPNCENMIRSVPGKIRKRMGYEEVTDYGNWIYGVHYYSVLNTWIVHAGKFFCGSLFIGNVYFAWYRALALTPVTGSSFYAVLFGRQPCPASKVS